MQVDEKFKNLLEQLLAKSRENKVRWRGSARLQNQFCIVFSPNASLFVSALSPDSEPDWARADLEINGTVVKAVFAEDSDSNYSLIKALYDDAHRSVSRWDVALSEIERQIAGDGPIGVPQSVGSATSDVDLSV